MPTPEPSPPPTVGRAPSSTTREATARAVLAAASIAAFLALAFLWPIRTATAKDLPLVVAGPPQGVAVVERALRGAASPFEIAPVANREAAVEEVRARRAYGALVVTPGRTVEVEILTASAASPAVAQALEQAAARITASAPEVRAHSVDLVPLTEHDPRGAGLAAVALPLTVGGLVAGTLVALLVRGRVARAAAVVGAALAAGLAVAAVVGPWLGLLPGSFAVLWGVAALGVGATAALVVGLAGLLGRVGISLAALACLPVAVPLAGAQLPPEFLPNPWGAVGQGLVPGATTTALRLTSYFPDATPTQPLLILSAWLVGGLALLALGRHGGENLPARD